MLAVRTDLRGLMFGVFASGLFIVMAGVRRLGVAIPTSPTWDATILWALQGGLAFLAVFLAGHFVLRRFGVGMRAVYCVLGALAVAVSFTLMLDSGALAAMTAAGKVLPTFAIPLAVGAVLGFSYHARAGYDRAGDDPYRLARVLSSHVRGAGESLSEDSSLAHIGSAEYFGGPLQVRTSPGAMLISAFGGLFLDHVGSFLITFSRELTAHRENPETDLLNATLHAAGLADFTFLATALYGLAPLAAVIYVGHRIAQGLGKQSPFAYGIIGLLTPVLLGILTLSGIAVLGFFSALPTAVAMILYRQMAGLEPKPVKEDIIVRDRRDLVGADHARRRFGRVVQNQRGGAPAGDGPRKLFN